MSQQVFDKYWPIGNVSAEEAIPGTAILQERDGKDEPINLAGNMVWDSGSSLWVPVSQTNPLEVRVRQLETLIGALNATKEADPDAASATLLALLRGLMSVVGKETTLGAVKTAVESLAQEDFATQTTLAAAKGVLDTIAGKDFATQTTLASLASAVATEATLDDVKTAVEALAALIDNSRLKTETTISGRVVTFADLTPGQELAPSESYTTSAIDVSGIGNGRLIVSVQKAGASNLRTKIDIYWNIPFESGSGSTRRTPAITLDEKTQVYGYALLIPEVVSHSLQVVITNTDASNTYAINRVTVRGLV